MDKLLKLSDVEKLLKVSKSTLLRWDNDGKLVAVRTEGGHRRYRKSDIDKIINSDDKERISYGTLYEHLCSAQYIAYELDDKDADDIRKIREKIGKKLLALHNIE